LISTFSRRALVAARVQIQECEGREPCFPTLSAKGAEGIEHGQGPEMGGGGFYERHKEWRNGSDGD
jgi:hypothetical protein